MTIRPAQWGDLPELAALFDQYRQFYEQPPAPGKALSFLTDRFQRNESVVLIAEGGSNELIGFCQLYPTFCSVEVAPIYVLYDLFVAPACRQGGVGRALLLAAEAQAHADGKARMDLTTARSNVTAQALYESLGWIRDEVFLTYSRRITTCNHL